MTENERAKLLERIRKLLALSTSSNENEAAMAAEKAQAMLAEHNLSMLDVKASDGDDMMKDVIIDNTIVTSSHPWRRPLGLAVARLYFCTYFYSATRGKSTNTHSFVGADHNVMVAVLMFKYLLETIDRLARNGAAAVPKSEQSPYRVAFRSACCIRLCDRIYDRIVAAKRGEIVGETGKALVLASLYDRTQHMLDKFLQQNVGKMRTGRTNLKTHIHEKGGSDGYSAGNTIGLDDQVAGAGKHSRIGQVIFVSHDKWRDAIKFLMGLGTNPTLTANDQKKLRDVLRGTFANGMSMAEATRYLRDGLKWSVEQ